jgi:hypothetical protein
MNIENVRVGSVLISDELAVCPLSILLDSGVNVVAADDKGFRLQRRWAGYNGEEFYLTRDALTRSHWILATEGTV